MYSIKLREEIEGRKEAAEAVDCSHSAIVSHHRWMLDFRCELSHTDSDQPEVPFQEVWKFEKVRSPEEAGHHFVAMSSGIKTSIVEGS